LEPLQSSSGNKVKALTLRVMSSCVLGCLAIVAALGLGCRARSAQPFSNSQLTVGFGFGGTALAGALQNLIDTLSSEPLVAFDWHGRTVPRLAVGWSVEDGARTIKLHLRSGVVFHDGTPLNAETVVNQLRKSIEAPGYDRVKTIDAVGPDLIAIRLREPDAFLLGELSKATIKIGTNQDIATGPFVLRSRTPEVVLEPFAKYHLGPPAISRVVVRTYETPRASWAAMMRGDVSFLYEVNRDAVGFVEAGSRIQTFSFPRPYYIPIVFNTAHPILGRRAVRQAINEAIDRSEIVAKALNNRGQPADGPVWPHHWAYNSASRAYSYNPEAARIRLDAAGLPVKAGASGDMPRRFKFRCLFWSEDAMFERIALVVQKQLFEIGIDVEMVPVTLSEIRDRHVSGDFEALLVQMVSGRSLDWVYWFWRSVPPKAAGIARSGYTAADPVLDRLRAAQSDDETRIAVADLQRVLYEDPPAAFLVRPETARAVDQSFTVPIEEKGRDILGTIWQLKPRPSAEVTAQR
jgi:peptide/nickel transport system substrate-binding protein